MATTATDKLTEPQQRLLADIAAGHVDGSYDEPVYISEYCQSAGGWKYFLGRRNITARVAKLIQMGRAARDECDRPFMLWNGETRTIRECKVVSVAEVTE